MQDLRIMFAYNSEDDQQSLNRPINYYQFGQWTAELKSTQLHWACEMWTN